MLQRYLDQLAAAKAYNCYGDAGGVGCNSASSGTCGGGTTGGSWVAGVNQMLDAGTKAGGAGTVQITEGNAEPYMKNVQGYLVLGALVAPLAPKYRTTNGVRSLTSQMAPAFPAVYGGHYVCTGTLFGAADFVEPDVFVARLAIQFSLGCQLGWFSLGGSVGGRCNDGVSSNVDGCGDMAVYNRLVSEQHAAEIEYLNRLLGWRRQQQLLLFLQSGRLSRPLPPQQAPSFVAPAHDGNGAALLYPSGSVGPFPSLIAVAWISASNTSLLVLCLNVRAAAGALQAQVSINVTEHGLAVGPNGGGGVRVQALAAGGGPATDLMNTSGAVVHVARMVPARSVVALRLTHL